MEWRRVYQEESFEDIGFQEGDGGYGAQIEGHKSNEMWEQRKAG